MEIHDIVVIVIIATLIALIAYAVVTIQENERQRIYVNMYTIEKLDSFGRYAIDKFTGE